MKSTKEEGSFGSASYSPVNPTPVLIASACGPNGTKLFDIRQTSFRLVQSFLK